MQTTIGTDAHFLSLHQSKLAVRVWLEQVEIPLMVLILHCAWRLCESRPLPRTVSDELRDPVFFNQDVTVVPPKPALCCRSGSQPATTFFKNTLARSGEVAGYRTS